MMSFHHRLRLSLFNLLISLALAPIPTSLSRAQSSDPVAESLQLTRSAGSLPVWEKPDARAMSDLSDQVRSINKSVFIIGHPDGGYGTGFVISQEHRLLATNAHVADILHKAGKMLAIGNESSDVYVIDEVWYHPGVVRKLGSGVVARTADPAQGQVFPSGPDVAVLHVAGDKPLPPALPLATPEEAFDLFGQPVGMIGFPAHDTVHWPALGENAQATYRQGVIARATDFLNNANAEAFDRQFLQHTMANWFGFSGSPIFLANGRVAALNNSGQSFQQGNIITSLAYGIRVDCLWELLAYHHLDDKLPVPIPAARLRLDRFEGPDPRLVQLQDVQRMVAEAAVHRLEKRYDEAGRLLNEAIRLMPNYAYAYYERGINFNNYIHAAWGSIPNNANRRGQLDQYVRRSQLCVADHKKALSLEPANVGYLLQTALSQNNLEATLAYQRNPRITQAPESPANRAVAQKVLQMEGLEPGNRSLAYTVYAGSLPRLADRIPWYAKAIEVFPADSSSFANRAAVYAELGRHDLAAADRRRAAELDRAYAADLVAWEAATSPDAARRNGPLALKKAQEACRLTDYQFPMYLDTLAAAYAENGDFDTAVRWALEALKRQPESAKSKTTARLRSYRNHQPWHK